MSKEIALRFDYGSLAGGVATEVARRTREIKELTRRAADDIVRIGNELAAVKAALPHGQFGVWLHAEFAWTERTARNMMRVAERFTSATVADLEFAPTALYLLSADDVPEAARQEAVQQAKAGKPVTPAAARAIVEKHVPPKPKPAERPPTPPPKTEMISVLPPEPTVIETTARDVTPPPSAPASTEPTATDVLQLLSPVLPKLRKVKENLNGEPFDAKAAGQHAAEIVGLLNGDPPAFKLVSAKEAAAMATAGGVKAADVAMPPALDTPECRKALADWIEHKRLRKPAYRSVAQLEMLVNKLAPLGAAEFIKAVQHSIGMNYAGVFPEKDNGGGRSKAPRQPGPGERFDPNHVAKF